MKTALVTTTINIPTVLQLYRKLDPDVHFFIVGDLKSPHADILEFIEHMDNATYFSPNQQKHWMCSEAIGWNCVQRRSIGFLEALKWGAEDIITWDTDNIPMNRNYFAEFECLFGETWNGPQVGEARCWFDVGAWQFPRDGIDPVAQRGTPQSAVYPNDSISFATDVKIGAAQGICIGDPDTSAVDRMSRTPIVHQVSELLRNGVVLNPKAKAAWNSQNTAFLRQFAPAMFMLPGVGRYDDIIASLLTQRVMRDRGYHVHFGPPFTWQQRNPHNLLTDLKAEMWGMEHVLEISDHIDRMPVLRDGGYGALLLSDVNFVRAFYEGCMILPDQTREAGKLWCDDIETVLK